MKDLKDVIMLEVLAKEQQQKALRKRVKAVVFSYIAAIFFAGLLLFFLEGQQAVSSKLLLPRQDMIIYYKLFAVSLVFSLMAFMLYLFFSRNNKRGYRAQSRST